MSAVSNQLRRAGAIFGTALFLLASAPLGQADHNTSPNFKIREGKNGRLPKLNTALPRYVQVFGLFIHATSRVPEAKLLHAADIAAELGPGCEIVEPGSGEGVKIRRLLSALDRPSVYRPIDVAGAQLDEAAANFHGLRDFYNLVRSIGRKGQAPVWDDEDEGDLMWEPDHGDERIGSAPGKFNEPVGVAISHGRLCVSEQTGRRIQVLTFDG